MITFELSPDVLGRTRFWFSPLTEVTLSLRLIGQPRTGSVHMPWLRQARERLGGVDLDLLLAVVPSGPWIADFLFADPDGSDTTIESQLTELTHVSPDRIAAGLEPVWGGRTPPRRVRELLDAGARGTALLAETLWDYWDAVVQPFWPRMCAVLEEDVAYRAAALMENGLFDLLPDLHREISVDGNRMLIDKPHHQDATYRAEQMTLTPSVFAWPGLVLGDGEAGRFSLTYGARGIVRAWEGSSSDLREGDPLGALLGRTRAAILALTKVPMSTTQIARELGQSPASVSEHLTVLRGSSLVTRRRSGRSVLYRQTELAESMLAAHQVADSARRRRR